MKQKLLNSIRLRAMMLVAVMCAAFAGQAWGDTTTYQHVFNAKPSTGSNITLSGVSWTIAATNLGNYNSGNYAGVQLGTSSKNGEITLTTSSDWGSAAGTYKDKTIITEVRLWLNLGGTSVTPSVTIGGKAAISDGTTVVKNSSAGTDWTKATCVTFTPASNGNTGTVVINVTTVKAGYICCMEIDCEEPSSDPSSAAAFANATPSIDLKDGNTYTQAATTAAGYSGTVTYALSANTAGASIEGTTVTVSQAGSVTVTANAAADPGNYSASSASYTLTVNDTREATSVVVDDTGITNTNVGAGTTAGSLSATVKDNSSVAIGGATVTWSGDNDAVATINASTGAVTLVAAGSVTFTATYAGTGSYKPSSETYNMTVTNVNPNLLTIWSENFSGYAADAVPSGGTYSYACVDGGSNTKIYAANLAGGTSPELLVGKNTGSFTATIPLDKYDGNLTLSYKTNAKSMTISTTTEGISISGSASYSTAGTHEVTFTGITASTTSITIVFTPSSDNVRLDDIELKGLMAAPQFSVPAGGVTAGTSVTLSATAGATIYYTTNGTTPSSSSTEYTSAISIDEDVTIKAIAIKDGKNSSVATATYTIVSDPLISLSTTSVAATVAETDGSITVTYNNLTNYTAEIKWLEADGTTPATYDWLDAEINGSTKNVDYLIEANDTYSSRTAYLKVYAVGDEGDVYSDLITITQAGKTIDFTTLPFIWAGGTSSDLTDLTGVTASGLGTDYAEVNAPYRIKFDTAGDYIQVKTDAQPVEVMIGVKMIGGDKSSEITVQESADGETFTDVEEFTISGSQNDVLNLKTTEPFDVSTRYVRIKKTVHGSNIGVGPIMITDFDGFDVTLNASGYATYASTYALDFSDDSEYTAWQITDANTSTGVITFSKIDGAVAAGTGVLLKGEVSAEIFIPIDLSGSDISATNLLTGITTPTAVASDTYYGLSGNTFKKVNAGTVPAGKALLPAVNVSADVKSFIFVFNDDATGITETRTATREEVEAIFNLGGQRMSKMQRGVNIVNGKKVLVK